jgi:hypothetical protein
MEVSRSPAAIKLQDGPRFRDGFGWLATAVMAAAAIGMFATWSD